MNCAERGVSRREVTFTVNGKSECVSVYPMERLLDVLRVELGLTGTKEGCGEGECGSCSVLLNGDLVNSCLIPVLQAQGANISTIEGLATERLHTVQQAFLDCGGAQCGICTPGMILATVHLFEIHPAPSMEEIREGLNGNLCRCTGYTRIFEAVQEASRREAARREAGKPAPKPNHKPPKHKLPNVNPLGDEP
jgi:aerobic carbon-monoxide dehydrogenase small subunit